MLESKIFYQMLNQFNKKKTTLHVNAKSHSLTFSIISVSMYHVHVLIITLQTNLRIRVISL